MPLDQKKTDRKKIEIETHKMASTIRPGSTDQHLTSHCKNKTDIKSNLLLEVQHDVIDVIVIV